MNNLNVNELDQLNYFSLNVLDKLGNDKPTQSQIDLMELLVSGMTIKQGIEINKFLGLEKSSRFIFNNK